MLFQVETTDSVGDGVEPVVLVAAGPIYRMRSFGLRRPDGSKEGAVSRTGEGLQRIPKLRVSQLCDILPRKDLPFLLCRCSPHYSLSPRMLHRQVGITSPATNPLTAIPFRHPTMKPIHPVACSNLATYLPRMTAAIQHCKTPRKPRP